MVLPIYDENIVDCMPCNMTTAFIICGVTVAPARFDMPQSALRPAFKAGPMCRWLLPFRGEISARYAKLIVFPMLSLLLWAQCTFLQREKIRKKPRRFQNYLRVYEINPVGGHFSVLLQTCISK